MKVKKQDLIRNLEEIIEKLKNLNSDDIVIWAYDPTNNEDGGGSWIVMNGKFELNENQLDIK